MIRFSFNMSWSNKCKNNIIILFLHFCYILQSELTKQQNMFKIELKLLEDELLTRLSAAESNFLGDNMLVEKLETTKHTAAEIEMKVAGESVPPAAVTLPLPPPCLLDCSFCSPPHSSRLRCWKLKSMR